MNGREIRTALREGKATYSSAVVATSPFWPAIVKAANLDFVFIDTEHNPLGRETLSWMCTAFANAGVPPVVRIPKPCPFAAAKVLDGGATGFVAPYIETVEQVRDLTAVARYRPLKGKRVESAIDDPGTLQPELADYLEERNQDTIFIANIESVPAIDRLDQLLEVGSIDAILIGPHDLSCSLGIPEQYDHPRFDEAVREIFRIARNHQVGAGIHYFWGHEPVLRWAQDTGSNLFMHSVDMTLYGDQLKHDIDFLKSGIDALSVNVTS